MRRWAGSTATRCIVGTDFGPGSMTDSGYPRIVQRVDSAARRGSGATAIFEARPDDVYALGLPRLRPASRPTAWCACHDLLPERNVSAPRRQAGQDRRSRTMREIGCFAGLAPDRPAQRLEAVAGRTCAGRQRWWRSGSTTCMAGKRELHAAVHAHAHKRSLAGYSATRKAVLLNVLDNVRSQPEAMRSRDASGSASRSTVPANRRRQPGRRRRPTTRRLLHDRHRLPDADLAVARHGRQAQARAAEAPAGRSSIGRAGRSSSTRRPPKDGTRVPYFLVLPKASCARWQHPDAALRLRRLRDLADARLLRRRRRRLARARRRLRAGQHPRRWRVRSALAPGGAEGEPAARL